MSSNHQIYIGALSMEGVARVRDAFLVEYASMMHKGADKTRRTVVRSQLQKLNKIVGDKPQEDLDKEPPLCAPDPVPVPVPVPVRVPIEPRARDKRYEEAKVLGLAILKVDVFSGEKLKNIFRKYGCETLTQIMTTLTADDVGSFMHEFRILHQEITSK